MRTKVEREVDDDNFYLIMLLDPPSGLQSVHSHHAQSQINCRFLEGNLALPE